MKSVACLSEGFAQAVSRLKRSHLKRMCVEFVDVHKRSALSTVEIVAIFLAKSTRLKDSPIVNFSYRHMRQTSLEFGPVHLGRCHRTKKKENAKA